VVFCNAGSYLDMSLKPQLKSSEYIVDVMQL